MAPSMVGPVGQSVISAGRKFYKMSGSGNDFVFFDLREGPAGELESPARIRALCARGTGVGADGVVFFDWSGSDAVGIRYYNSDGSGGELCGNATLCAVRMAELFGAPCEDGLTVLTDAGTVSARLADGLPEIDLEPVSEVELDFQPIPPSGTEKRVGYVLAGVPHIAVEVPDVAVVNVMGRGAQIRRDRSLSAGANVNFLAPAKDGSWMIRTYERGVEGETLACGTGAVASTILLAGWGRAVSPVRLITKSGRTLTVRLRKERQLWYPSLRGNAELVFVGQLPSADRVEPE
jgi:diaminopimelate epimerase